MFGIPDDILKKEREKLLKDKEKIDKERKEALRKLIENKVSYVYTKEWCEKLIKEDC